MRVTVFALVVLIAACAAVETPSKQIDGTLAPAPPEKDIGGRDDLPK